MKDDHVDGEMCFAWCTCWEARHQGSGRESGISASQWQQHICSGPHQFPTYKFWTWHNTVVIFFKTHTDDNVCWLLLQLETWCSWFLFLHSDPVSPTPSRCDSLHETIPSNWDDRDTLYEVEETSQGIQESMDDRSVVGEAELQRYLVEAEEDQVLDENPHIVWTPTEEPTWSLVGKLHNPQAGAVLDHSAWFTLLIF